MVVRRKNNQPGLFDSEFRMRKIDSIGDPLVKLSTGINWKRFRTILEKGFTNSEEVKGPGGRPPYDFMIRFKILVLQSLYNLSDDAMEYQLNDRRTFQRFVGIDENDPVPDAKTIWLWRETLTKNGAFTKLFNKFWKVLDQDGILAKSGSIIDASFVEVPKQRNSKDENDKIKNGETPEEWESPEKEPMLRQKDVDARWTKKRGKSYYGYKNHIKIDRKTKLIKKSIVTPASVHDSQVLSELLDKNDREKFLFGDSAYSGEDNIKIIRKNKIKPRICEKGYRNKPLTKTQMKKNKAISKVRARVEHVFATMTMSMGGMNIRCIGMERADGIVTLKNLAYNLRRYCLLYAS